MKNLLISLFLLLSLSMLAVPARRVRKIITLPDGTERQTTLVGDENMHFFRSDDGTLYSETGDNGFCVLDDQWVKQQWNRRVQRRNEARRRKSARSQATRTATVGQKRGLVILVNFSDRQLTFSQGEFDNFFNQHGYHDHGMSGSVHDYFYDCSYGQFDLEFDVVGPVTVSKSVSYYGKNGADGDDLHAAEMVGEAIHLADAMNVDFSKYDWNGDREVDQVYVIYAGFGEASGAPSSTIWPHEYDLSSASYFGDGDGPIFLDGVFLNTYACSNELYGISGKRLDGIGTACHEFSHCLGIPDMYDTVGYSFGMNCWDLMDYGCYGDDGYSPVGYTSYERWVSGWLTPVELTGDCEVADMPSLDSSPMAYIIYNNAYRNEYYLLENRQQDGWHKADYGHGLLILHVDYSKQAWNDNTVNNVGSHQRMTIIPADNKLSDRTDMELAGDPWPGIRNNTSLTDHTTPASMLFHPNSDGRKLMGMELTDITEDSFNHTVSFAFARSVREPEDDPNSIAGIPFRKNDAPLYNLQGQHMPAGQIPQGLYIRDRRKVLIPGK